MDSYHIDSHKLYWHLDRVLRWQEGGSVVPIYLEISPVSYCNHRCQFCGIDFAMGKFKLDKNKILPRLKEMGSLGVRSIMYAGEGEPLLHPDLSDIIKETKANGMDVGLTTNGTCERGDQWEKILPHLTWVKFSIDAGSRNIYQKIHGVPPSQFEAAVNSINRALQIKKKYNLNVTVGIQYLLVEENFHDVENAMVLSRELGVDYLILKSFSRHPKMIKEMEVNYSENLIECLEKKVQEFRLQFGLNVIFRKTSMEIYRNPTKKYSNCHALPFWGYVSSTGDFYTCSIYIGDKRFCGGNIYNQSMKEIFFGEKRKEIISFAQSDLNLDEGCRVNCRMARINEFLEMIKHPSEHVNFI